MLLNWKIKTINLLSYFLSHQAVTLPVSLINALVFFKISSLPTYHPVPECPRKPFQVSKFNCARPVSQPLLPFPVKIHDSLAISNVHFAPPIEYPMFPLPAVNKLLPQKQLPESRWHDDSLDRYNRIPRIHIASLKYQMLLIHYIF